MTGISPERRKFTRESTARDEQKKARQQARGLEADARQRDILRKYGRQAPGVTLPDQVFAQAPAPALAPFVGPPALPHTAPAVPQSAEPNVPPPPNPNLPAAAALPAGRDPRIAEYAAKIAEREAMQRRMAGLDAAARQAASEEREAAGGGETMEHFYARSIEALGQKQSQAMGLEKQGLANHAKTQAVVADIQRQIEEIRTATMLIGRNADNLLSRQQRTQQNTTGNP